MCGRRRRSFARPGRDRLTSGRSCRVSAGPHRRLTIARHDPPKSGFHVRLSVLVEGEHHAVDPDGPCWVDGVPAERMQTMVVEGRTHPSERQTEPSDPGVGTDPRSRALAIWPGLDRRKLTRTCGDPYRIACLVARRTALPIESILRLLGVRQVEELIHGRSVVHTQARPSRSRLQASVGQRSSVEDDAASRAG